MNARLTTPFLTSSPIRPGTGPYREQWWSKTTTEFLGP